MCIDYRLLNKNTRLDRYPIPRIDDLLDRLAKATIFSKIDLSQAYHQVAIQPGDEYKTAFQSRFGLFEYVVLPFGLCNAPATFQRLMNSVFHQALDDLRYGLPRRYPRVQWNRGYPPPAPALGVWPASWPLAVCEVQEDRHWAGSGRIPGPYCSCRTGLGRPVQTLRRRRLACANLLTWVVVVPRSDKLLQPVCPSFQWLGCAVDSTHWLEGLICMGRGAAEGVWAAESCFARTPTPAHTGLRFRLYSGDWCIDIAIGAVLC